MEKNSNKEMGKVEMGEIEIEVKKAESRTLRLYPGNIGKIIERTMLESVQWRGKT